MQPQWKNGKKHQCPPKAYIRAKYRTTLQLLHLQDSSKKKRSPSNASYGARSIYNGNGLNVSDGALRTEGYLNVADAAYPNEGSQNVPNGALLNSRRNDPVCTINFLRCLLLLFFFFLNRLTRAKHLIL